MFCGIIGIVHSDDPFRIVVLANSILPQNRYYGYSFLKTYYCNFILQRAKEKKLKELKEIKGKKIRRQYFTIPVLMHYVLMVFVPYCILIFSIQLGKFHMQEWISSIWISVWVCFCFSLPWVLLKFLNRLYFGQIVCVLTEDGIYYKDGLIEWNRISKIEYVIDLPSRYKYDPTRKCRAVIYTENKTIILYHAPRSILRSVKKFKPQINARMSNGSKWLITILVLLLIFLVPLIPFLV